MVNAELVQPSGQVPRQPVVGVLAQVLSENRRDCLSLGMFVHYVKARSAEEGDALRLRVLRHLENALAAGYLVPGDVVDARFHPWSDSYSRALKRVESAWPAGSDLSYEKLQDVCWLANTASGDRVADVHRPLWSVPGSWSVNTHGTTAS